MLTFFLSQTR